MTEVPGATLPDGPGGLKRLQDGSLVVLEKYSDRYSRAEGLAERDGDRRTETERDRGRIAYSSALRRLAGVTQVVSPDLAAARMHSRQSHTFRVALVARELAEQVVRQAEGGDEGAIGVIKAAGGLDIAACEAAGLAHDLGHSPFGHAGETALHRALYDAAMLSDGFEGNPQSFRIVTRLAGATTTRQNMDLTNVTLCAILKYPWSYADADRAKRIVSGQEPKDEPKADSEGAERLEKERQRRPKKFGAYEDDLPAFQRARLAIMGDGWETNYRQSLEASIMDLADDIAYAVHDLEDFVLTGTIDLHDVLVELEDVIDSVTGLGLVTFDAITTKNPFVVATRKLREDHSGLFDDETYLAALSTVRKLVKDVLMLRATEQSFGTTLRAELSNLVSSFFRDLEVSLDRLPSQYASYVRVAPKHWHELQALKVITRHWLISSPGMGVIQRAQTEAITSLATSVREWLDRDGDSPEVFPEGLRSALKAGGVGLSQPIGVLGREHLRAIADYVCGMSDSEALLRANWLAGRDIPGMTMVVEAG